MKKFLLLLFIVPFFAQAQLKREFRGAWVASVTNLDFPTSNSLTTQQQKDQITDMFDQLKAVGINAIIFQVRTECDALYDSPLEPWSYWLTGQQGKAPNPYYDPLHFAVEEAHKRGMELHAWMNPYRAVREVSGGGSYQKAANHVSIAKPDWLFQTGNAKILDPGKQAVRNHVAAVTADILRRYDVDGIHMDDYFYPYPPDNMTANATNNKKDSATYANEARGFSDLSSWRRDNINLLIKQMNDSIIAIKPYVKFGMSPFGIWKNGVPTGIIGMDAYGTIYCDAVSWLQQKTVDYLTPQLYWPFGGSQDYGKLMPWWNAQMNGRHLYPGHGSYRINSSNWSSSEVPNQIRLNRSTANPPGSVFFRARVGLLDNLKGFADSLKTNFYKYIALPPVMPWKDTTKPNQPLNPRFEQQYATTLLRWDQPAATGYNDSVSRYVVYRFGTASPSPADYEDPKNIIDVVRSTASPLPIAAVSQTYYFSVSTLDRYTNESVPTGTIQITPAQAPTLALPVYGQTGIADTVILAWKTNPATSQYHLQVSTDSTFAATAFYDNSSISDSSVVVKSLLGETKYFWRVRALNPAGASAYSAVFAFTTGFPAAPLLAFPPNMKDTVSVNVQFAWRKNPIASNYRFQLSTNIDFNQTMKDSNALADTTVTVPGLPSYTILYWRVKASNSIAAGAWSPTWRFRTEKVLGVEQTEQLPSTFVLHQNYPNPFNPSTTIRFSLIEGGATTLKIYDLLGRELAVLVDSDLGPGNYAFDFQADNLTSGVYIYRLVSGRSVATKKMLLQK